MAETVKKRGIDVIYIIILGIMSFMLLYNMPYIGVLSGDVGDGTYSIMAGMAQTIHDGELPLWNPYMWGGMTEVGNTVAQAMYPVAWLICKVCYNAEVGMLSHTAVYYMLVIHIFILASGFYFLFRTLKLYSITSFVIAVLSAFCGCAYMISGWQYIYSGLTYIPWFLGFIILMMTAEDKRRLVFSALAGGVFGLAGLASSSHGILFLILTFAVMYFSYLWSFRKDKLKMLKITGCCFLTGGIGLGIMSVSLLPFIEFMNDAYRYINGGDALQGIGKMSFESFTNEALNMTSLRILAGSYYGWFALGTALVIFVLFGFFYKTKEFRAVYWCGVSVLLIGLLYSCSLFLPNLIYYIPYYDSIREPYLYTFLFALGSSIIGAFGLNGLLKMNQTDKFEGHFYNPAGLFICYAILLLYMLLPQKYTKEICIICLLSVFLLFIRRLVRRKVYLLLSAAILLLFSGLEYLSFRDTIGNLGIYTADEAMESVSRTNLNLLRLLDSSELPSDEDAYRIMQWTSQSQAYPSNIWSVWGYNDAFAYMNPAYNSAINVHGWKLKRRMQIANLRYLVCTDQENASFIKGLKKLGLKEVRRVDGIFPTYDATQGVTDIVYENMDRKGNAWIVRNWKGYSDEDALEGLNAIINSDEFDPFDTALVNVDTCKTSLKEKYEVEESEVRMTDYNANSIKFQVSVSDAALMVTSEMIAPGWEVYIDGKKEDILEVNTAFRGCVVPKGEHIVEYKYLPMTFVVGSILSIISLLMVAVICGIGLWNRRKEIRSMAR